MGCGGSTKTSTTRNESRKLSLFGGNPVVMEIGEKVAMKRNPGPVLIVVFGECDTVTVSIIHVLVY